MGDNTGNEIIAAESLEQRALFRNERFENGQQAPHLKRQQLTEDIQVETEHKQLLLPYYYYYYWRLKDGTMRNYCGYTHRTEACEEKMDFNKKLERARIKCTLSS